MQEKIKKRQSETNTPLKQPSANKHHRYYSAIKVILGKLTVCDHNCWKQGHILFVET